MSTLKLRHLLARTAPIMVLVLSVPAAVPAQSTAAPTSTPAVLPAPHAPAAASAAGASPAALAVAAPMTGAQVIQMLDQAIDWYRTLGVQQQIANEPSDLL